ncbi:MAG: TatD family nuclease-associated radical SAM protein [Selenomonadaceae bacterium]
MITYTLDENNGYVSFAESIKKNPVGKRTMYINITNQCSCNCTFCLRNFKEMAENNTLWLKDEPTIDEIKSDLNAQPWSYVREVVFCGFGEPTMRLDDLLVVMAYVRKQVPTAAIRLNTNGLSDLQYEKDTASLFAGLLDTISISLNAATAERYLLLTRSQFGLQSYEAMLNFAVKCKQYVPNVVMTVVDTVENAAEIDACRILCGEKELTLRVRPYEAK